MTWEISQGDALSELRKLKPQTVQTVITSPPYWGLRDYGSEEQLGLESTPDEYVQNLVEVFREVKRVLREDGTVWLNLGDSYTSGNREGHGTRVGYKQQTNRGMNGTADPMRAPQPLDLKPKDLCGIPWRVAFALQADGWYLRSDIIWAKPNPMPESVRDRPTRSHEYIFLLTKSARYFFDQEAVREPHLTADDPRARPDYEPKRGRPMPMPDDDVQRIGTTGPSTWPEAGRNIRSVWNIATQPFSAKSLGIGRRVLVAPDEAGDGTTRIPSPSCPVHGGHSGRTATAPDGGHADDGSSRTADTDSRHVQEQLGETAPTDPSLEPDPASDGSRLPLPADFPTASAHSTESRKTVSQTASGGTACEGTTGRTEGTERSNGSPERDGSDSHDSTGTPDRTAYKPTCSCEYYRLEEPDHFATFPPKLVEPCILAGSSPKACGECGAPWERVVERQHDTTSEKSASDFFGDGSDHGVRRKLGSAYTKQLNANPPETIGWRPTCGGGVVGCGDAVDSGSSLVLDPFCGSGTVGVVALRHGRSFFGMELNPEYVEMARQRILWDAPLLNQGLEKIA